MNEAAENVTSRGITSLNPINIRPTHYYVRFSPKNWLQYDALVGDSSLNLSDFPLDYEITQDGNSYHDSSIPDSLPTYQYASVPINFNFNDTITYEILSELYIPEMDDDLLGKDDDNESYIDQLLDQAYVQTGNFEDTIKNYENGVLTKYHPGGKIQLFDNRLNQRIGMEGVIVCARRWFEVRTQITDHDGNYRMNNQFKRPVNYSISFGNNKFFVAKNFFGTVAWINGPKQKGDWNYDINDGYDRFAGHVFRAAFNYNYSNRDALKSPSLNFGRIICIASNENSNGSYGETAIRRWSMIRIWRKDEKGLEFASDEVFTTTTHEIAHISHRNHVGHFQWNNMNLSIKESWAVAVEWRLTGLEYQSRGITGYGNPSYAHPTILGTRNQIYPNTFAYQYWNRNVDYLTYTSLFIDLFDSYNEFNIAYPTFPNGSVNDNVNGYAFHDLENMLVNVNDFADLVNELKAHKPTGVTDSQIDQLLAYYQ